MFRYFCWCENKMVSSSFPFSLSDFCYASKDRAIQRQMHRAHTHTRTHTHAHTHKHKQKATIYHFNFSPTLSLALSLSLPPTLSLIHSLLQFHSPSPSLSLSPPLSLFLSLCVHYS